MEDMEKLREKYRVHCQIYNRVRVSRTAIAEWHWVLYRVIRCYY